MNGQITVQTTVRVSLKNAWEFWNAREHIAGWAVDSDDWEITAAENDLRVGGKFTVRTRTKDGSETVDFVGEYTNIETQNLIEYDLEDGRRVKVEFEELPDAVRVTEVFEPEEGSDKEEQQKSWLATLENFRAYAERQTTTGN